MLTMQRLHAGKFLSCQKARRGRRMTRLLRRAKRGMRRALVWLAGMPVYVDGSVWIDILT